MSEEKTWMDLLIEEKMKEVQPILEKAFHQAVVCGECTIRITDDKKLEIVNPFKGCDCGD